MKKFLVYLFLLSVFALTLNAKNIAIVTEDYPPFEYLEKNEAKGINVDIVKEAFKRMGNSTEIKFIPWQRALFYTKYGKADAILDASYKKSRAKFLYYPKEETYAEKWYCFKIKGAKVSLNKDFSNTDKLNIGVIAGYTYGGKVQNALDKKLFKSITRLKDEENLIQNLFDKKYDMFIGNKTNTLLLAKKLGYPDKIEVVKMTNTNQEFILSIDKTYLAFSKKTISKEFVKKFSDTIATMKEDGSIDIILKRYF